VCLFVGALDIEVHDCNRPRGKYSLMEQVLDEENICCVGALTMYY
jgi:hypothetical protein